MQRSPSPSASACSSHSAGGNSRRMGDRSMQKAKRKPPHSPQAFGGMATRSQENKEDWRWAVAQIEQQLDAAGPSGVAGLAATSQQARESSGSGAPSQQTIDERLLSAATPPRAPPAAAYVSVLDVPVVVLQLACLASWGWLSPGTWLRCGREGRPEPPTSIGTFYWYRAGTRRRLPGPPADPSRRSWQPEERPSARTCLQAPRTHEPRQRRRRWRQSGGR
jgi:hypothetical protein